MDNVQQLRRLTASHSSAVYIPPKYRTSGLAVSCISNAVPFHASAAASLRCPRPPADAGRPASVRLRAATCEQEGHEQQSSA
jgi:hypothetical protein